MFAYTDNDLILILKYLINDQNFHLFSACYVLGTVISILDVSILFDLHSPIKQGIIPISQKTEGFHRRLGSDRATTGIKVSLAPQPHAPSACHVPRGTTSEGHILGQRSSYCSLTLESGHLDFLPLTFVESLFSKVNYPSADCITYLAGSYQWMKLRKWLLRTHGPS